MKKLFTILSMALVGVFASQAASVDYSNVTFEGYTPEGIKAVQKRVDYKEFKTQEESDALQHRRWTNGNNTYEVYIERMGKLTDMLKLGLEGGGFATFDMYPYYAVRTTIFRFIGSELQNPTDQITLFVTWPTYYTWEKPNENPVDVNAPEANMVTLSDFTKAAGGQSRFFTWGGFEGQDRWSAANLFPMTNSAGGVITFFPLWSTAMDVSQTINGVDTWSNNGAQEKILLTNRSTQNRSTFALMSYEPDNEDWINMPADLYFTNGHHMEIEYDGSADVDIDIKDYKYDFNSVHIFNAGEYTEATAPDTYIPLGYPEVQSWANAPVNRFYVIAPAGKAYAYEGDWKGAFAVEKLGCMVDPADRDKKTSYMWIEGSFFGKVGAEVPEDGPYTMIQTGSYYDRETRLDYVLCQPEVGKLVPYTLPKEYTYAAIDGFRVVAEERYKDLEAGTGFYYGTTEGFMLDGNDLPGNTFQGVWNKNIVYHYNPAEISETREISSIGTYKHALAVEGVEAAENFTLACNNGVISISVAENAPVAVYDLSGTVIANTEAVAGQTLNVNAGKGLYIVKVGKAAKKVML